MLLWVEKQLVFVLPMQLHQTVREVLQCASGGERPRNERAASALRRDFATHDNFVSVVFEDRLNGSEVLSRPDQILRRSSPQQETDGLDENGLAGAGLARQNIERVFKFDCDRLEDRQVPDRQVTNHKSLRIMGLTAFRGVCYRCTRPRDPSSAHHNRTTSEALLPTPGSLVLALQLPGSATSAPVSTGSVIDIIAEASPVSQGVLSILLIFSVVSWAVVIYKWLAFRKIEQQSATFIDVFRRSSKFSEVHAVCKSLEGSPLVGMFQAGYAELNLQLRQPAAANSPPAGPARPTLKSLAAVDRALLRASSVEVNKLEKRVPFLATTASITPFIGLFGTVWGIMLAFFNIGAQGSTDLAVVAPGIADALIATAFGLFAAIPAVYFYNHFTTKVKTYASEMDDFALEFLNIAERNFT
jgi:biopolymer transport protein TolQ